jgi:hypothetical protein
MKDSTTPPAIHPPKGSMIPDMIPLWTKTLHFWIWKHKYPALYFVDFFLLIDWLYCFYIVQRIGV